MSADNGIYVIKTKRTALEEVREFKMNCETVKHSSWTNGIENFVYRVAHVQAIDNLDYYKEKQLYNLGAYMHDTWGESEVFTDEGTALVEAHRLAKEIEYVEYGVSVIDMSEHIFYGDH